VTPDERRAATEAIYHRYRLAVLGWAYRIVRRPDDAEDVAQHVWIAVHRSVAELQPRGVTRWLQTTCRNAAIDCVRARQRRASFAAPHPGWWADQYEHYDGPAAVPEALIDRQTPESLLDAYAGACALLAGLRPADARMFAYLAATASSHSEAARDLGLPLSTLKTRIRRAQRAAIGSRMEAA